MRPGRQRTARSRGEGYAEYVIVLTIIMICSIVGLLTAGSKTMQSLQYAHGICHDCPKPEPIGAHPPAAVDGPTDHPTTDAPTTAPDAQPGAEAPPSDQPAPVADAGPPTLGTGNPTLPGGTLPGDPNAATQSFMSRIIGWFTGWFA